ncbi:MAG: hypothetical protein IPF60_07000 [Betaproteobacteria bacterium]|nr:hypothetical protein [Betaproteobacteria bacterium]
MNRDEVAPGTTAEVEDRERRAAGGVVPQQRFDVQAHVVIARALPERFGAPS